MTPVAITSIGVDTDGRSYFMELACFRTSIRLCHRRGHAEAARPRPKSNLCFFVTLSQSL